MSDVIVNVATDFYPRPSGRYKLDGDHSGQAFRDDILFPKLNRVIEQNSDAKVVVDFTDVTMAGSSFLEEAFGGLIRVSKLDGKKVLAHLKIISSRKVINDRIQQYIREAAGI